MSYDLPVHQQVPKGDDAMRWMRNRWYLTGLLMLACSGGVLLVDYGREWITVDHCLDAGGVYDYDAGHCRGDVIHLHHVPYAGRRKALLAGAGGLALCGAGLITFGRRKS